MMNFVIGIVDYGLGNLRSVERALLHVGARTLLVKSVADFGLCKGVVFPGQGAFSDCIKALNSGGMLGALREWIFGGNLYLGICLGLQALFDGSDEGRGEAGLGVVKGRVVKFGGKAPIVPHMGWNCVKGASGSCPLFDGVPDGEYFYFDHSYYCKPTDGFLSRAMTDHGEKFPSVIWRQNFYGVQFHPEKSQKAGLRVLRNFCGLCK